jgi:hypothetical protein
MRLQITLKGEIDYERTIENLRKSPIVSNVVQTEKGIVEFGMKDFPEDKIQITPTGKVNIYTKDISVLFERFVPYINLLSTIIVGKEGKYWTFEEETYNLTGVTYKELIEISKRIREIK